MAETAAVPDVGSVFTAAAAPGADAHELGRALAEEAGLTAPQMPAPPRIAPSADPDAPHGRDAETNEPLAPYGIGRNGKPRIKPAGPGRGGKKEDAPRVTEDAPAKTAAAAAAGAGGSGPDFIEELAGLADTVWLGMSFISGGRVPVLGLPLPDTRPYAAAWRQQSPQLVVAWNEAAKQNKAVRGWVSKLAGQGSWQWVIGVSVASAGMLAAFGEVAKKESAGLRHVLAEQNDAEMRAYIQAMITAGAPQEQAEEQAA